MKFIEYILVKESDLEDLFVSYNAKDNIELIHEMEYKLRNIIKNKYKLNPKLYVNVVKRFSNFALEAYNQLSPSFHELFKYWLSIHNISSPEAWAEAIYAEYEEFAESEGVISVGGVSLTSAEIFKELESDDILKILKYNFGGDILNNFSAYSGHFLTDVKSYPVPEDENEDYWIDNEYDAIEMIIDNYWESEYALYVAEVIRDDSDGYLELGEYGWKIGLEKVLYPKYYQRHGYNIETAIPEVEEAIERIESGNSSRIDAENIILNLHSDDEDLDQQITRLMKLIGNLTIAISLSMNVMHTCGNIMTDYGDKFGLEDIDPKFLDDFNTRSVGDWNDELRKIIRDI